MRIIKCKKCGESGIFAGGLHKVGDDEYQCNNAETCKNIANEKLKLLSKRKALKK